MSAFWARLLRLVRPQRNATNSLLKQEWSQLAGLWRVCAASAHAANATEAAAIDAILAGAAPDTDSKGWAVFNDVELRVGAFLTPVQLAVEYASLLQMATERALRSLPVHKANAVLFGEPGTAPDPANLDGQRAAYAVLLADLQSNFIEMRFRRALRSEVAERLFRYGLGCVGLAVIVPLLLVWRFRGLTDPAHPVTTTDLLRFFSDQPIYGLTIIATFGILGAFFSRAIAFQNSIASITFDEVMTSYVGRVLRMRLLYGMIGAVVFFFVLRGNLVGGSIFPDLDTIGEGKRVLWSVTDHGVVPNPALGKQMPVGPVVLAPTTDMAKLLVWSFLAGFSERLVPETLAKTEAKATAAN